MTAIRTSAVPLALSSCLLVAASAHAASPTNATEEAASRIKTASAIGALGTDLFGEQVSFYSGSVEFSATDLSLPGNFGLPVALTRRFAVDTNRSKSEPGDTGLWFNRALGDWELDIPYLSGTYSEEEGWTVGGGTVGFSEPYKRCSAPTTRDQFRPKDVPKAVRWMGGEFWGGINFRSHDGAERPVLFRDSQSGIPTPSAQSPKLVTSDHWWFSCLPSITGGQGEGFLAHGPDGTTIYFDVMVQYEDRPISKYYRDIYSYEELQEIRNDLTIGGVETSGLDNLDAPGIYTMPDAPGTGASGGSTPVYVTLERVEIRLYPSKIVDRFGNTVNYQWEGGQLTRIHSPDGREIRLAYDGAGPTAKLVSAQTGSGSDLATVTYQYSGNSLQKVTLPDGKSWTYNMTALHSLTRYTAAHSLTASGWDLDYTCSATRKMTGDTATVTITHPFGATGTFKFAFKRHLRSDVDPVVFCGAPTYAGDDFEAFIQFQSLTDHNPIADQMTVPVVFDTLALTQKSITGDGLSGLTWTYDYENLVTKNNGALGNGKRRVVISEPQGKRELLFGAAFMKNEGQLLRERVLEDGRILEEKSYQYVTSVSEAASLGLPGTPGLPLTYNQDTFGTMFRPMKRADIMRDGVTFTTTTNAFEGQFGKPISTTQVTTNPYLGSNPDPVLVPTSVTETTEYYSNLSLWVIGQVKEQARAGKEVSRTTYSSTDALPTAQYSWGSSTPDATFTYRGDGTLKTVSDARGRTIQLNDWYRGTPREVILDSTDPGNKILATVSNQGWVLSVTDQFGSVTSYTYDNAGRITSITPPSDTPAWLPTTMSLDKVAGSEVGLSGNRWRHTVSKGNHRSETWFDSLLRPVRTREYDATNKSGTSRHIRREFDYAGREIFTSRLGEQHSPTRGILRGYDALGRQLFVLEDSEIGELETRFDYLDGFRQRTINPRGQATITSFQTFGSPDASSPVMIQAPGGVLTRIQRDAFGKALSITRSGTDGTSLTRSYVYDSRERLCKQIEPETGATAFGYDAADALIWSAAGLDLPGNTSCNQSSVPAAAKVQRTYDLLGRLDTVTFPDGRQNLGFDYARDGKLVSATAGSIVTTYAYNKLRLPTGEVLSVGGTNYGVGYRYDSAGALEAIVYPDGSETTFSPDAFGRPTRVGDLVTSVHYDRSGHLDLMIYGNGIIHHGQPNERLMPFNIHYQKPGVEGDWLYSQDLHYDANTNVVASQDLMLDQRRDRRMSYDAQDRLIAVNASDAIGGDEAFVYDALDNIRQAIRNGTQLDYNYSATNRLQGISVGGVTTQTFAHDARGRMIQRNGATLNFDDGDRLAAYGSSHAYQYDAHGRRAYASENGEVKHFLYSQGGQLLFEKALASGEQTTYHYLGNRLVARASTSPTDLPIPVLSGPAASSGSHQLQWTSVSGATRYLLEEQFNDGGWMTVHDGAGTSKSFSGRAVGSYRYRVAACDASRCGSYSAPLMLQVRAVPVLTVPASSGNGNYTVSWTEVAGASAYRLQERASDASSWTTVQGDQSLSHGVSGKPNGTYEYRVCAVIASTCTYSDPAGIRVGAVAAISITPDDPVTNEYTVSWTSVSGAIEYRLEERKNSGSWSVVQTGTGTGKAFTGKSAGNYQYRVRACLDAGCEAPYSLTASRVVRAGPTISAPVSSVSGTYVIEWTAVEGAVTYRLEERTGSGSWASVRQGGDREYSATRRGPGAWEYRVRACNRDDKCGPFSSVVAVNVSPAPVVTAPGTNTTGTYAVTWSEVPGVPGYRVEERVGDGPWIRFDYQTSRSHSFTHGNGEYHYRVAVCADAESCGALSSEVTTTVLLPPDPPTLYPPSYSRPDFTVKWSESPTATSYRLEESFDGGAWTVVYNGSGTSIDFTDRLVGQYRYRVRACNLTCGDYSSIITYWVIPQRAPNLAGSVHSNGDHSLSWAAMQGVTWYELDEKSAFVWMRVHSGPETTKLLPGREAGTYLYRIRACSDGGCSDWGTEFQLVNQTQPPPPAVPSLSVTSGSGSSFTVSWDAVAGATSYRLEERVDGDSWIEVYNGGVTSKVFSGKGAGEYQYRLRACNSTCSSYTSTATRWVAPAVPTFYTIGYLTPSYTVSWNAVAGATSYRLEESVNGGSWAQVYSGSATSKAFSGKAAAKYRYRVRACNSPCSSWSAVATRWVVPTAPNLAVSGTSTGNHSISWAPVPGADRYILEEKKVVWLQVHDGSGNNVLLPNRQPWTYYYRIRACNGGGCGSWGQEMKVVSQGGGGFNPPGPGEP